MPLTSGQLTALRAIESPSLAEVVAIYWDGEASPPTYYGAAAWHELPNFLGIPYAPVEPRLLSPQIDGNRPGLTPLPMFPDLLTPSFQLSLSDTDGDIRAKLELMKRTGSVKAEIFYYFPDIDATSSMWFGHITHSREYGLASQTFDAVSGVQGQDFLLPSEIRMKECSARAFGGELATQADVDRSICPYDRGTGGSVGLLNGGVPFTSCPRLAKSDCSTRFGTDIYWPGYDFEARGVTVSSRFINTKSQNNDSLLRYPISVVWGAKIIMELPVLQFYTRTDVSNPDRGTVHALAEVSNDQCESVFNVLFNGSTSNVQSYQVRLGTRGQSPTGWVAGVANFSGRTHLYVVGQTSFNPISANVGDIKIGAFVHGFKNGRIYTDATTFTKAVNNNRVWAVLELYTNNRWGMGDSHSRFDLANWVDVSNWTRQNVRFTLDLDSGNRTWDVSPRTIFDCNMQGMKAGEQILSICQTGRFSVPFQYDGKYRLAALKEATSGELAAAPVFSDKVGGNILRSANDSTLKISQADPKDLANTVVVEFEDAENNDIRRPLTCRDQDQMARAGKLYGGGGFKEIKRSVPAYGVRRLEEAVKFGYSVLWFGTLDSGGIYNNARATFRTPLRQALNLSRFQIIKIETDQLLPESPDGQTLEYYRVMDGKIEPDGSVTVMAQAYNPARYATFETVLVGGEPAATEAGTVDNFFTVEPVPEQLTVSATYADGYVTVDVT